MGCCVATSNLPPEIPKSSLTGTTQTLHRAPHHATPAPQLCWHGPSTHPGRAGLPTCSAWLGSFLQLLVLKLELLDLPIAIVALASCLPCTGEGCGWHNQCFPLVSQSYHQQAAMCCFSVTDMPLLACSWWGIWMQRPG